MQNDTGFHTETCGDHSSICDTDDGLHGKHEGKQIIIYLYNIYFKYYFNLFSISLKYVGNSESNSKYSLVEGCINPSFLACNV